MCQILDIDSENKTAEKDLTFYKVLCVREADNDTVFSLPFMGDKIEVGKTYEEKDQENFSVEYIRASWCPPSYYTSSSLSFGTTSDSYSGGLYQPCIASGGFHLFKTESDAKTFMVNMCTMNVIFKLFRAIVPKGTHYIEGYYDVGGPMTRTNVRTVCAKKVRYEFMEARRHRK